MAHDVTSSSSKEDNATIRKTALYLAPLLKGNIQFRKLGTAHENLVTNELRLRNVSSISTDGIRMLAAKIEEK